MDDPVTASARAVEESAKAGGKALEIVRDTGGYLGRVFAEVPTDLVGVLGGAWLHEQHLRLRDRFRRHTEQILRERNVKEFIQLSPNIAADLISGAQEEARDELMELWARLLANAMDPQMNSVRGSFIDAVKKMDPIDALLLRFISEKHFVKIHVGRGGAGAERETNIVVVAEALARNQDEIEISLRHLQKLEFFDTVTGNPGWFVNATNREFMRACYPEHT